MALHRILVQIYTLIHFDLHKTWVSICCKINNARHGAFYVWNIIGWDGIYHGAPLITLTTVGWWVATLSHNFGRQRKKLRTCRQRNPSCETSSPCGGCRMTAGGIAAGGQLLLLLLLSPRAASPSVGESSYYHLTSTTMSTYP